MANQNGRRTYHGPNSNQANQMQGSKVRFGHLRQNSLGIGGENPIDQQDDIEFDKSVAMNSNHNIDTIMNSTQHPVKFSMDTETTKYNGNVNTSMQRSTDFISNQ